MTDPTPRTPPPVSDAVVQHQAEQIARLTLLLRDALRQRDNATDLLNEQAQAMKDVYRESDRVKELLRAQADLQEVVDHVNTLTAERFAVLIVTREQADRIAAERRGGS